MIDTDQEFSKSQSQNKLNNKYLKCEILELINDLVKQKRRKYLKRIEKKLKELIRLKENESIDSTSSDD